MDSQQRERLAMYYADLSDDALREAYDVGREGYLDPEGWDLLSAEWWRRADIGPPSASAEVTDPRQHDSTETTLAHAAEQLRHGVPVAEIESYLRDRGLDAEQTALVVDRLAAASREAAHRAMRSGALWFIGGTVITVLSYQAAAAGGTYVVAWGAILFGAIRFLKGASATVPERDADAGAEVSVSRAAGGTRNGRLAANDARPGHDAPAGDGPAARPDGAGGGPSLGGTIAKALVVALIVVVVARVVWLVLHEGW